MDLAHTVVDALEAKKGENILLLDLQKAQSFTDYFVICTGSSGRMLEALADGALDAVRLKLSRKGSREGPSEAGWVVLDFGAVVVHLFAPEQRSFYRLEDLWSQAKIVLHLQ